jgi:predicted transcriptional regulator
MTEYRLPDDVRALLYDGVETYEQLEIVLMLIRDPAEPWTVDTVATALGVSDAVADDALQQLLRAGLVAVATGEGRPRFAYAPKTPAIAATVDRLRDAYADHRLAVINEITANALQRVRTSAIRAFARAFVFEDKDKKHDG